MGHERETPPSLQPTPIKYTTTKQIKTFKVFNNFLFETATHKHTQKETKQKGYVQKFDRNEMKWNQV